MKYRTSYLYTVIEDLLQRYLLAVQEYEQQLYHGNLSDSVKHIYKSRILDFTEDIKEIKDTLNFLEMRKNSER